MLLNKNLDFADLEGERQIFGGIAIAVVFTIDLHSRPLNYGIPLDIMHYHGFWAS